MIKEYLKKLAVNTISDCTFKKTANYSGGLNYGTSGVLPDVGINRIEDEKE